MAVEREISAAKKGMNRNTHPSELGKDEYSFALNSNIQDEHGNGPLSNMNETSNVKCTGFKGGYKVIGHKYDVNSQRTYFFLVNLTNGCSEIGYINSFHNIDGLEPLEQECDCNLSVILEDALENVIQQSTCQYFTVLSDFCEELSECSGCLNFSVDSPIHESNVHIKEEVIGTTIYWTDGGRNPQRYLQLDNLSQYTQIKDDCEDTITTTCLQCDKLRIFKKFERPCLQPNIIQNGGNLRSGAYEALVAYSNQNGDELSDYYSITNPIPIHDRNNNILDQTNLDYLTNQAIALSLTDLDIAYEYYKIVIIYTSGLDGAVTYYNYGVYTIDNGKVTISTLVDKPKSTLTEIGKRRPFYTKAKGMASGNGYLFQYGLESHREINLQRVVNLMGSMVRWATVQAAENLYDNGVFISNYKSYMRDEVYPLSIKFFANGGYETPNFVFIPRPALTSEIEVLGSTEFPTNTNTQSIVFNSDCFGNSRNKRWQFENTARLQGNCAVPGTGTSGSSQTEVREVESECSVLDEAGNYLAVDEIVSSSFDYDSPLGIVEYINQNTQLIIDSIGTNGADIRDILEDPTDYTEACTPEFGDNCDENIDLVEQEIFAISVGEQSVSNTYLAPADYSPLSAPTTCNTYVLDESSQPKVDDTFVLNYMEVSEVTYQRFNILSNTSCASAIFAPVLASPQTENTQYINNLGETGGGITTLQTSLTASTLGTGFTNKIHKNALWYRVDFNSDQKVVFQMSHIFCGLADDNSGTSVRISVFDSCSSTTDLASYGRIVTDVTLANDPLKFVELDLADFSSGTAYVVIDAPIRTRTLSTSIVSSTITPPCGCFSVYRRDAEFFKTVTYSNLKFGKRQTYKSLCSFVILNLKGCDPVPHKVGTFGYWESEEKYICNKELFDSSDLVINPDDIPSQYQSEFESNYTSGLDSQGNYVLTSEANFMDKPIRHFRFPDSKVVPFMSDANSDPGEFKDSTIYPIGFFLSNDVINAFLDVALKNGLLTNEERLSITKYEIFRGDRSVDKSVIAKGMLFDMYEYIQDSESVFYPNYPLNSLGADSFNNIANHRFNSQGNNLFTFHSPDTHFYKPPLTREMAVEGYQFGNAEIYFDEVEDHSTYVLLGDRAYQVATALAIAETLFELLLQTTDFTINALSGGAQPGTAAAIALAVATGLAIAFQGLIKVGEYRYKWIENFRNLGRPKNFAYYSAAIGFYNYFRPNTVANSSLRGLTISTYLKASGRWSVTDESLGSNKNINNLDREDSVLVSMGSSAFNVSYPTAYANYDNETTAPSLSSRAHYGGVGRSERIKRRAASPYASLKQYLPSQYGQLNSIEWLHTGYCGDLNVDNTCVPVFGGDTYISRFSLKRKLPFFTNNAHDLAPLVPYKYSDYFNINPDASNNDTTRYYIDYLLDDDDFNFSSFVFPSNRSKFNLDFQPNPQGFYINPPAKFYLFSYGIPYFLVESEINCNFRYGKKEKFENFYPNIKDVIDFTQESNVSIKERNTYFYNFVFSNRPTAYPFRLLPNNYNETLYKGVNNLKNSVIYSQQDSSETAFIDPWLNYKALDFYQFPTSYGDLVDIDAIESEQILGRFENGFTLFNAVDQLRDRLTQETEVLGAGGIFSGRNLNFNKTDLGYSGTQNVTKVTCEFGSFWADAMRGQVFNLAPGGSGLDEISGDLEKWFRTNLPFKILLAYPDTNIDNAYNGIGLSMVWDAANKRVFLSKRDYKDLGKTCRSNGRYYRTDGYEEVVAQYLGNGFTYNGIVNCKLSFSSKDGITLVDLEEVFYTDTNYFENHSWTVAYSVLTKTWISYYSFVPNYYIGYNNYFQTGINYSEDMNEFGLWSHLPFLSSHQVFYGKKYPWIVEYPFVSKGTGSLLESVQYWMDTRKYYNRHDFSDIPGVGFNKAIIYNNHQNSGQLKLVTNSENDLSLSLEYPKHGVDSIEILQSDTNGKWVFNYFYNLIKKDNSGLPIWKNDPVQIHKTLNNQLLNYNNTFLDRMRGDYFLIRMVQDKESRYKMIFRFSVDTRDYYDN